VTLVCHLLSSTRFQFGNIHVGGLIVVVMHRVCQRSASASEKLWSTQHATAAAVPAYAAASTTTPAPARRHGYNQHYHKSVLRCSPGSVTAASSQLSIISKLLATSKPPGTAVRLFCVATVPVAYKEPHIVEAIKFAAWLTKHGYCTCAIL
jgi:hypothetical protein